MKQNKPQPGDLILDRYMPDASPEEREEARQNLQRLAEVYVGIIRRLVAEGRGDLSMEKGGDIIPPSQGL